MLKSIYKSIKQFNWKLWLVLAITLLIPALYQSLRIFFLGDMPGDWGVNIASQLSWVNLLYEIIEEAFILPLFFLLGKSLGSKEELEKAYAVLDNVSNEAKEELKSKMTDLANDIVEKVLGYRSEVQGFDNEKINEILYNK